MIGKSTSPHDGTESRRRCEPARRERERTPGSCKLNPAFCKAGSRRAARPSVKRGVLIPLPGGTEHNETGRRPVNSGGTADITRQLVRPGERAKAVFFIYQRGTRFRLRTQVGNAPLPHLEEHTMERTEIASLYRAAPADGTVLTVCGWAKNIRDSKNIGFIALSDGGCFKTLQVVFEAAKLENYEEVAHAGLYTSMRVTGRLILTPQAKQPFELNADSIEILGACPSDEYPLQKKKMSMEYLRTMPTLRPRTNTFSAAFRVRSVAAYAIHRFFQENGFVYAHSPILTASDCEGAGEMFRVTTLDLDNLPKTEDGRTDYSEDFFGRPVNLTVSGQLEAEAMAMAFGKVYTFGPTFRAEKSFTTRHAAEFWMIEPEMAFCDLSGYMDVAEAMTKYVIRYVLDNCPDEMDFFNKFIDKGLIERLELVAGSEFGRVSYTDAVEILKKNNKKFQYPVEWGVDIQTEHERYLTEVVFKKPVFVTDYPKEIKSFYMKQNPDGKTVAAADMLVPGIGELIGGSQREEDYDKLAARMDELGLDKASYDWYLDLRRFGTVEHAGFGLGFERMLMYLTGIQNIRDVLPFPRTAYGF